MYLPPFQEIVVRVRNRLAGGYALPRPRYITDVAGSPDVGHYLASGRNSLEAVQEMLARNHVDAEAPGDMLDFGCGSGRILRHWRVRPGLRLHGTDYNPKLVAWCRRNYPFAEFRQNPLGGPLPWPDASFDLIYAWSVFTHLPEELVDYWIGELARALRPGALLYATFHGAYYEPWLSPEELARFRAGETVVHRGTEPGTNICAVFHAPAAVRRAFGARFDVLDFTAGAPPLRAQDQYLMRAR